MLALNSDYQRYQFTEEELATGYEFSPLTRAKLQDLLATKAVARLSLNYDFQNPGSFLQEEAYLKGQMELLVEVLAIIEK